MKIKVIIISIIGLVTAAAVGYGIYYLIGFFVVSTTPKDNAKASVAQVVQIRFNKELDPAITGRVTITPQTAGKVELNGKTLTFTPTDLLRLDTLYQVKITNPKSKDGADMSDVVFSFTTAYLPDSQLDKATLESQKSRTDKVEESTELIRSLPQETLDYKISYDYNADKTFTYHIVLYAILNRPDQRDSYIAQLKQFKQEALDFMKSKGEDPTKLNIIYEPAEAQSL